MFHKNYSSKDEQRLYEIFLKTLNEFDRTAIILQEGSISHLIMEELDQSDVDELRQKITVTKDMLAKGIQIASQKQIPSLQKYFTSMNTALDKAAAFAAQLDLNDPKGALAKIKGFFGRPIGIGMAIQSIVDIQSKAVNVTQTLANALELIGRNIPEDKFPEDKKLADIESVEGLGLKVSDLEGGIQKAFKAAQPKGIMGKLGSFFSKAKPAKIPGAENVGERPIEDLTKDLLQITYKEFKGVMDTTAPIGDAAEKAAPSQEIAQDIATAAKEEEAAKEAKI